MEKYSLEDQLKQSKKYFYLFFSQASFKKLKETQGTNGPAVQKEEKENPLNPATINNLNEFYIQNSPNKDSSNHVFNLSNFYINHGKYFSGNNLYNVLNNINNDQPGVHYP